MLKISFEILSFPPKTLDNENVCFFKMTDRLSAISLVGRVLPTSSGGQRRTVAMA